MVYPTQITVDLVPVGHLRGRANLQQDVVIFLKKNLPFRVVNSPLKYVSDNLLYIFCRASLNGIVFQKLKSKKKRSFKNPIYGDPYKIIMTDLIFRCILCIKFNCSI